ncbi:MAG: copper resistance protein CopC [Solirubrobacterales bacterium]
MKRFAHGCCILLATCLLTGTADAHATLAKAIPAVGSTLGEAPAQVILEFTERIEPALSTIQVNNASGTQVSAGRATLIPGRDDTLAVALPPILPGTYKVTWKVVSEDTHVTRGSFTFTVLP